MPATLQKLSSIHHLLAASGARFTDVDGWRIAERFGAASSECDAARSRVGLADLSYIRKFEIKADSETSTSTSKLEAGGLDIWKLARRHWLGLARWDEELSDDRDFDSLDPSVTDVTSAYCSILLIGPDCFRIIQKLSSLNTSEGALPNQSVTQASLGKVHCIFIRNDVNGIPAVQLLLGREYGEYIWNAVMDAGSEYGIQPLGLEALKTINV